MSGTLSDKGKARSSPPVALPYFSPPYDLMGPGTPSNAWNLALTHNFAGQGTLKTQIGSVNTIVSEKGEAEALKKAFKPYEAGLLRRFWYWLVALITGKAKILPKFHIDQIKGLDGIGDFPIAMRVAPHVKDFGIEWLKKRDLRPKTLINPHGPQGLTGFIVSTIILKIMDLDHRIDPNLTRIIKISMMNRYPLYVRDRLPYLLNFLDNHQDSVRRSYDAWILLDECYVEAEEEVKDMYSLACTDDLRPPLTKTKMINLISKAIAISSEPGAQPNLWNLCSRIESNSPLKLGFAYGRSRSIRYLPIPGRRYIDGERQRADFIEMCIDIRTVMRENGCTKGETVILLGAFPKDGHELLMRELGEQVDILPSSYDAPFQAVVAIGPIVTRARVLDEAIGIKRDFLNDEIPLNSFLPQEMVVSNPNPYEELFAHYAKEMGLNSIDDLLRVR